MGVIKDRGDRFLRDFAVKGVPSSGVNEPSKAEGRAAFAAVEAEVKSRAEKSDLLATNARLAVIEAGGGTGLPGDGLTKLNLLLDEAQGWVGVEPDEIIPGKFARSSNSAPLLVDDAGFQVYRFRLPAGSDQRTFRAAGSITNNPAQAAVVVHTAAGAFVAPYGVGASGDGATAAPFTNVQFSPSSVDCDVYVTTYSTAFGRRPPPVVLERLDAVDGDVVIETVARSAEFEGVGWDWQPVPPIERLAKGFYYSLSPGGALGPISNQQAAKYAVQPGRSYRITCELDSSAQAGAIEFDADGEYLTSQFVGPDDLTIQSVTFGPETRIVAIDSFVDAPLLLEVWAPLPIDQDHAALKAWQPMEASETLTGAFVLGFDGPAGEPALPQFGASDRYYSQAFDLTGVKPGTLRLRTSKISGAGIQRAVYLMDDDEFVLADPTPVDAPYLDAPLMLDFPVAAQKVWITSDTASVIEVERFGRVEDAGQRLADLARFADSLGLADLTGQTVAICGHSQGSGGPPQGDYATIGGLRAGSARVFNLAVGDSRMRDGFEDRKTPGVTIETANPATEDPLGIWGQNAFAVMTSIGLTPAKKQWIIDNWTAIRPHLTGLDDGAVTPVLSPFWIAIFLQTCLENLVDTLVVENGASIFVVEGPANDFRFDLNTIDPDLARADLFYGIETDVGTRDRSRWVGVMNCLVDQVLAANRKCWIILMEDDRSGGIYDLVREAQAAWAAQNTDILFCPQGSKNGWSYSRTATEDGTTLTLAEWQFGGAGKAHPFENANPAPIEMQRKNFTAFLRAHCHPKA